MMSTHGERTEEAMSTPDPTVPRWFADYAERSAKAHGELEARLTRSYGDLEARMIRWIAGLFIVQTGTLMAAIHFFG